jgi:hypothetical protein
MKVEKVSRISSPTEYGCRLNYVMEDGFSWEKDVSPEAIQDMNFECRNKTEH